MMLNADQLQFGGSADCQRWVESLPLTNVQLAQQLLLKQIGLAKGSGLPPLELLKILEALREPVAYVQNELARKYTGKSLPLDPGELAVWNKVVALWIEMGDAYQACRAAHLEGDSGLRHHGALIVMRCLRSRADLMFEHYRIYHQVPAALWTALHQLYAFAEQSGYAQTPVISPFGNQGEASSCMSAYCHALLAQLANPFALSGRQMDFLARWLDKWSGQAGLAVRPLPPSAIPSLAVDLAGSGGPQFADGLGPLPTLRYLDLEALSHTLRQVIALLKQGETPARLGLGEDARQPGCENLLMLLYVQWCRAGTSRTEPRTDAKAKAQVCLGMHAAHFHISGRVFHAPGSSLTRQEEQDMELFGHVSDRTHRMLATQESSAIESWQLMNKSTSGFLYMVREPDSQMRISHNQLVAVQRGASKLFSVGIVQWLRVEENGELFVGIRLFPGIARALAVRPANFNPGGSSGFERALMLPEVPAPATPATVILPSGWFHAGRLIEMHVDKKQVAKLVNLLEKGADFDRCTVTLV